MSARRKTTTTSIRFLSKMTPHRTMQWNASYRNNRRKSAR